MFPAARGESHEARFKRLRRWCRALPLSSLTDLPALRRGIMLSGRNGLAVQIRSRIPIPTAWHYDGIRIVARCTDADSKKDLDGLGSRGQLITEKEGQ